MGFLTSYGCEVFKMNSNDLISHSTMTVTDHIQISNESERQKQEIYEDVQTRSHFPLTML